jgi:hypothetical protein
MRTAILILSTILTLATGASAQPDVCQGRYAIDGDVDLGAGVSASTLSVAERITLDGSDAGFAVRLGDCSAELVTRVPRDDLFVLRAKFVGCGERPRFRLRLAFSSSCRELNARVRSGGRVVDAFTATVRSFDGGNASDPLEPTPLEPDGDPSIVVDPVPPSDGTVTPIGTTPTISSFSAIAARPGDTISIFGTNLDRNTNGARWVGVLPSPPFQVTFANATPSLGRARATLAFVSPSEIKVSIPSQAASGKIILAKRVTTGDGETISETPERLIVVREEPPATPDIPQGGQAPATANRGTLTVQPTDLSLFNAGSFPAAGPFQIGAFLDANDNNVVDLFTTGRNDVPYLASPVRTSDFDFTIEGGRGYFQGSNAMLWVFFEGGDPNVLDNRDQFVVIHLSIDLAARTARPIAMLAGVAGSPGIVMLGDVFANDTSITVAQPGAGIGAIRGRISSVPLFLETIFLPSGAQPVCLEPGFCADPGPSIETRLWSNGIVIDFDVPLFADSQ